MRGSFNPEMLALARDARGFTQGALIKAMRESMSQAKLSKIENGLVVPNDDDVDLLGRALRFRREFFFHSHIRRSEPATYHRKRQKLSKGEWATIYARAEIYRISISIFLKSLELAPKLTKAPFIDPDEHDGRVEEVALAIRQLWAIPRGPIQDITSILENAGIVVIAFDFGTELCDGFSQHPSDGVPAIIFVNTRQPKDKLRFTLAHELGHLVMHRLPNPNMENEANRFASEFLVPTADVSKDFYNLSLDRFMALKLFWRVSMQALILKAHHTGRMTESTYRYYLIQMSKKGWKTREPIELTNVNESPRVLRQVVLAHMGKLEYTYDDLSKLIGLHADEIGEFYGVAERPRLRLVT